MREDAQVVADREFRRREAKFLVEGNSTKPSHCLADREA
jgi:hypothetical protein